MIPYAVLYEKKCKTSFYWFEIGENIFVQEIFQETIEKVKMIQENIRVAKNKQKSYHDKRSI